MLHFTLYNNATLVSDYFLCGWFWLHMMQQNAYKEICSMLYTLQCDSLRLAKQQQECQLIGCQSTLIELEVIPQLLL